MFLISCGRQVQEIPDNLTGNYFDKSGMNYWKYSIQKHFIISNCRFWEIKKIKTRKNNVRILIENAQTNKWLSFKKISDDDYEIKDNGQLFQLTKKPDSLRRKPKNNPCSMRPGKVIITGYIHNPALYSKENPQIEFLYNNYLTLDDNSVYADIDSLGRFKLEMELLCSQDIMYRFNNVLNSVFAAPDDTLMLYIDPEKPYNLEFQGKHSDVCYDIQNTREKRFKIDSPQENNKQLAKPFTDYKAYRDQVLKQELEYLHNYMKQPAVSEIFKTWDSVYNELSYYCNLTRYSWTNYNLKNREISRKAYESFCSELPATMIMNDTIASISGMYFFFTLQMRNLLADSRNVYKPDYVTAKRNEIRQARPSLTADEIKKELAKALIKKQYTNIMKSAPGRMRDICLAQIVIMAIEGRHMDEIDYAYNLVKDTIQYTPYKKLFTDYYIHFKKKEASLKKLPVTLWKSDNKGNELLRAIIRKNKNKAIILDFWFTGCGACRNDFTRISAFKKDLYMNDVEFVYLCYDSSEKDWQQIVNEYNLSGQHFLLTNEQFMYLKKKFSITSAPRYILINKAGKIVNTNFRPPLVKDQYLLALKNALH